jgi:uncharacterized membrane protein
MKLLKNEWLQWLILAAPLAAAALLWDRLPALLPIHWNIHGRIDGYAGKRFVVLVFPCLNLALAVLLALLPRWDRRCREYDAETKASIAGVFKVCRLGMSAFFSAMAVAIFLAGLKYHFDMGRFLVAGAGLLFAVMGNSMAKLRPNSFAGFRTPWTFASRTVWMKTHRLGGWLMVGCGLALFVESLLLPFQWCLFTGVLPMVVLVGIVPMAYSYFSLQAEKKTSPAAH